MNPFKSMKVQTTNPVAAPVSTWVICLTILGLVGGPAIAFNSLIIAGLAIGVSYIGTRL